MMDDLTIGIDLGTTNSCVALYINGKIKILENNSGGRITPSFIFFTTREEVVVGEHARNMAKKQPDCGIYEVKRFVGRKFSKRYIQNNLKYLPFTVSVDVRDDPKIVVKQAKKIIKKSPQELRTIILAKLTKDAEAKLSRTVSKAVITVPAYFNVRQREVTLAAAKDAGFTVLKLLNEPTAAALSYYFENDCRETTYSLVYDLGGGTFDVTVLKKTFDNIEILSVDGDTQLGGHDLDNLIVNYVSEYLIDNFNCDPKADKSNLRRLHNKCEDAKKALSLVQETTIILIGFDAKHHCLQISLTRDQFEDLSDELLRKTIGIVDSCLKSSGISKTSVDEVILSGGSTRIPKIQRLISEYFDGKTLNKSVNPDECVAEGAAIQAALLSKNSKQVIKNICLTDVVTLSLGTAKLGHEIVFMIKRNSPIPAHGSVRFCNLENQQTSIWFPVYEGERTDIWKNRFLGKMNISNITPAPPSQCEIDFFMNVDENGILSLKATETFKENVKELTINYTRGARNENEIRNSLRDAEENKLEDEEFKKIAKYKSYLIKYCIAVMYNLDKRDLSDKYRGVYDLCLASKISGNDRDLQEIDKIIQMIEEIKLQCEPYVKYYNFDLMPVLD